MGRSESPQLTLERLALASFCRETVDNKAVT
jgi:hypothetical protein